MSNFHHMEGGEEMEALKDSPNKKRRKTDFRQLQRGAEREELSPGKDTPTSKSGKSDLRQLE